MTSAADTYDHVYLPLAEAPFAVAAPSASERAWMLLPIIGWLIASNLEIKRRTPMFTHIAEQLARREEAISVAWGDDRERQEIAAAVCEAIQQEFGWPNAHYYPDDELELLMWGLGGGMGGEPLFCYFDVERRLGVKLNPGLSEFSKGTLGKFVECIKTRR